MKGRNIYFLGIAILVVVVVLMQFHSVRKFNWKPTFATKDKEPFGCCLFDSLMRKSIPSGYDVTDKTFYQIKNDSTLKNSNLLVVTERLVADDEMTDLLEMVDSGMNVTLVAMAVEYHWMATLGFQIYGRYFSVDELVNYTDDEIPKVNINWMPTKQYPGLRTFNPPEMVMLPYFSIYTPDESEDFEAVVGTSDDDTETYFDEGDSDYEELPEEVAEDIVTEVEANVPPLPRKEPVEWTYHAYNGTIEEYDETTNEITQWDRLDEPEVVVASRSYGKGKVVVCTTPLLFTNFGVLYGDNVDYLMRVLSIMDNGKPILRATNFEGAMGNYEYQEAQSPLKFFLSQSPLRWAIYLTLTTILIFMIFTAKRRQRAIPVYEKPVNRQVEFAKLIGTLYFQKGDHLDLLQKKYKFFAETVRRLTGIDIDDDTERSENVQQLASLTGMDKAEMERSLKAIRHYASGAEKLTEQILHIYIDKMDEILNKLD